MKKLAEKISAASSNCLIFAAEPPNRGRSLAAMQLDVGRHCHCCPQDFPVECLQPIKTPSSLKTQLGQVLCSKHFSHAQACSKLFSLELNPIAETGARFDDGVSGVYLRLEKSRPMDRLLNSPIPLGFLHFYFPKCHKLTPDSPSVTKV